MTITVQKELNFYDLLNECWSGALNTLNTIQEHNKEEELMSFLALDCFSDTPDMTEVNDLLWFEDEWIFDMLGISEEEDDDDDEPWEEENDDDPWDDDPRIDEAHDGDRYDF